MGDFDDICILGYEVVDFDYNYIDNNFCNYDHIGPVDIILIVLYQIGKVNAVCEVVSNVRIEIIWKASVLIVISIIFFDILIIFARLKSFGRSYKM